jgi:hypothetical protein
LLQNLVADLFECLASYNVVLPFSDFLPSRVFEGTGEFGVLGFFLGKTNTDGWIVGPAFFFDDTLDQLETLF